MQKTGVALRPERVRSLSGKCAGVFEVGDFFRAASIGFGPSAGPTRSVAAPAPHRTAPHRTGQARPTCWPVLRPAHGFILKYGRIPLGHVLCREFQLGPWKASHVSTALLRGAGLMLRVGVGARVLVLVSPGRTSAATTSAKAQHFIASFHTRLALRNVRLEMQR